jgi:2-phosphosulfolactate phosphatase
MTRPPRVDGGSVVVIDVLRASTTIVTALANGAAEVVPCLHVDEALRMSAEDPAQDPKPLLGGERGGQVIPGFDLGNSPREYTREVVAGRRIYFTTTNGTRAIMQCRGMSRVAIGSFLNLSAVCRSIGGDGFVELLCAGTRDAISRDDVLLAGAIVQGVLQIKGDRYKLNDSARLALEAWSYVRADGLSRERLAATLHDTIGGRDLIEIGQALDLISAAEIDRFDVVPLLDVSSWCVRLT